MPDMEKPNRAATLAELAAEADERRLREHQRRMGIQVSRPRPRPALRYSGSHRGGSVDGGSVVGDILYAVFIAWWADS